jgi:Na+/melibiose symporter-like transporter
LILFINTVRCSLSLFFPPALLTLAKWTSLSDVLGRKFLLHISMFGVAVSFLLNWFAATRFNFLGYHVYYIEAVLLGLIPSGSLVNPAVFAYTGKASDLPTHGMNPN